MEEMATIVEHHGVVYLEVPVSVYNGCVSYFCITFSYL